jgi:ABC-2 type transport system permease protein
MLLLCGVNVNVNVLPGWLEAISRCLPLTHGIEAAREVSAGATLTSVDGLVATEAGIAVVYAAAAYFLLRFFEEESRRKATLDRM